MNHYSIQELIYAERNSEEAFVMIMRRAIDDIRYLNLNKMLGLLL